jgi:hypothetical protein
MTAAERVRLLNRAVNDIRLAHLNENGRGERRSAAGRARRAAARADINGPRWQRIVAMIVTRPPRIYPGAIDLRTTS